MTTFPPLSPNIIQLRTIHFSFAMMFTLIIGCHKISKLHKKRWESTDLVKLLLLDTKKFIQLFLTTEDGAVELGSFRGKNAVN